MDLPLKRAIEIIIKIALPDKIILFGSRVGNNYKPDSDYDLLILKKNVKKKRELAQKIYSNFENIGAPVDVIVVDIDQFEKLKNDSYTIYNEALKNGRIIYEQK